MIEKLLERFRGTYAYENGLKYSLLAKGKSTGSNNSFEFEKVDISPVPVPILVTLKNRKEQIPYENEMECAFNVRYINQNDEEHVGFCCIPVYADKDLDFPIFMQEPDDFVKEVIGIEPRVDRVKFDLTNLLGHTDFLNRSGFSQISYNDNTQNWTDEKGYVVGVPSIESGVLKITLTTNGANEFRLFQVFPLFNYMVNSLDNVKNPYHFFRVVVNNNPMSSIDFNKLVKVKLRVKLETQYNIAMIGFATENKMYARIITADPILAHMINATYILPNVWTEVEVTYNDLSLMVTINEVTPNMLLMGLGTYNAPDGVYSTYLDYIDMYFHSGNIGDNFEIIGLEGNICRFEAMNSLMLSQVLYATRTAHMQKYTQTAYSGGLNTLAKDYGLSLSFSYEKDIVRMLTRLFSTYTIPAKSVMQSSMTLIYSVIDPSGYIVVNGDYINPYKIIVDVYRSLLEFNEEFFELLEVFIERYRPVPATVEINIIFDSLLIELPLLTDSGEVEIETSLCLMSPTTLMGSGTIMGDGSTITLNLPGNFP